MSDVATFEQVRYPSLQDRHVLITGGGTGIGAAFVEAFVQQGARVHFFDIAVDESQALAASLKNERHAPHFTHCDLTDLTAIQQAMAAVQASGPVQVLVNNAANDVRHQVADVTPEFWQHNVEVNLRHLFFCAQAVAPGMKALGGGSIINLGSISWYLALPQLALYMSAKAAIEGLTRGLARDLGPDGIRVNTLVPGAIRTPKQTRLWHSPEEERRILAGQCIKARVDPEDVAAMALFLASDSARRCTGREYVVDGGWYGA
jgi:D-xylose 1-dehydrogenase